MAAAGKGGARVEPGSRRVFGVAAHIDAGKTTVSERMLFVSGVQYRPGLVDEGTTVLDFEDEERERGITIHSAAIDLPWGEHSFTLVDTPGHVDFTAEVERCMRVLDGCVLVVDASKGVEAQTETVWRQASARGVIGVAFINKLDKVGADWDASLRSLEQRLGLSPLPTQLPWRGEDDDGDLVLVDLCERCVHRYEGTGAAAKHAREAWPDEPPEEWVLARMELVERLAEFDEELLEVFAGDGEAAPALLHRVLRAATLGGHVLPVCGGAALRGVGVEALMDLVAHCLPSPRDIELPTVTDASGKPRALQLDDAAPIGAQVFKVVASRHGAIAWLRVWQGTLSSGMQLRNSRTERVDRVHGISRLAGGDEETVDAARPGEIVAVKGFKDLQTGDGICDPKQGFTVQTWQFPQPVIGMAVEARKSDDRDRLIGALEMMCSCDPTMRWLHDEDTGQLIVRGMGELHLEILAHELERDFKIPVQLGKPRVSYRESIDAPIRIAKRVEKEVGQRSISVWLDLAFEPDAEADVPQIEDCVPETELASAVGRLVRARIVPALHGELASGLGHGFPATKMRVSVHAVGGEQVPSLEDFEAALALLLREVGKSDALRILEPWMRIEISVPEDCLAPVLGDVQSSGGEVHDVQVEGASARVQAIAPLSRLLDFTTRVRSLTQGRGAASMQLGSYREIPRSEHERVLGI